MLEINRVTEKLFQDIHPDKRKTFTCDNGKEFCGHQELSQKLGADFYFATPYHSWERGLNEHNNIANGQKAIKNRLITLENGQKNLELGQSEIKGDI